MIRARPRPLCRFGSQPIDPPAVKWRFSAVFDPIPPHRGERAPHVAGRRSFLAVQAAIAPTSKRKFDHDCVNGLNDTIWRFLARFRPFEANRASLLCSQVSLFDHFDQNCLRQRANRSRFRERA